MSSGDIARSRKQRVFAVLETTRGTLKFPATSDFIAPAGNAIMNQSPTFEDSEELSDTLDILGRFENALPAGEWSLPMYVRPSGTIGSVPQGDPLWQSLQGSKEAAVTAALNAGINDSVTTFTYKTLADGILPNVGVVLIGTEKILYTSITRTTATTGTCSGCTRGFDGTTAAAHLENAAIAAQHIFYRQNTEAPSFSLWIETDYMVQGMAGCSVNQMGASVSNTGGVLVNFSGQGMRMVYAGNDSLSALAAASQKVIYVYNSERFSEGSFIWNVTKEDSNADAGYQIDTIDYTLDKITLKTNLAMEWAKDDVVEGYLPNDVGAIGDEPVENRLTTVSFDGVAAKFRTSDLTFNTPKQYIVDEVGTTEPEDYIENTRSITATLKLYSTKVNVKYFTLGFQNEEILVVITFGDTAGEMMSIIFPKVSLEVPEIAAAAPAVELSVPIKALGIEGEDSCEIVYY